MPSLLEDVIRQVREGLSVLGERTERYTKMGRLRIDMLSLERQTDQAFSELGRRVYHLLTEEPGSEISHDDHVRKVLSRIGDLQAQLDEKRRELQRLERLPSSGREQAAATATSR